MKEEGPNNQCRSFVLSPASNRLNFHAFGELIKFRWRLQRYGSICLVAGLQLHYLHTLRASGRQSRLGRLSARCLFLNNYDVCLCRRITVMHISRYQPLAGARELIFSHGVIHTLSLIKKQAGPLTSLPYFHRFCPGSRATFC